VVETNGGPFDNLLETIKDYSSNLFPVSGRKEEAPPNLFEIIASSVNITQDRITRSRMAGDPPDVVLTPRLSHIGLLEFHRAGEAIARGRECVEIMRPAIEFAVNQG
jgi:NTE family protein